MGCAVNDTLWTPLQHYKSPATVNLSLACIILRHSNWKLVRLHTVEVPPVFPWHPTALIWGKIHVYHCRRPEAQKLAMSNFYRKTWWAMLTTYSFACAGKHIICSLSEHPQVPHLNLDRNRLYRLRSNLKIDQYTKWAALNGTGQAKQT